MTIKFVKENPTDKPLNRAYCCSFCALMGCGIHYTKLKNFKQPIDVWVLDFSKDCEDFTSVKGNQEDIESIEW